MNQVQNEQPQVVVQQQQGNGLAVTGLVLGIIGLVFCWIAWLGIILGVLSVICGASGSANQVKRGMAIAGIVLGILAVLFAILIPIMIMGALFSTI